MPPFLHQPAARDHDVAHLVAGAGEDNVSISSSSSRPTNNGPLVSITTMSARRPTSSAPMLRAVARVPAEQARCHSSQPLDASRRSRAHCDACVQPRLVLEPAQLFDRRKGNVTVRADRERAARREPRRQRKRPSPRFASVVGHKAITALAAARASSSACVACVACTRHQRRSTRACSSSHSIGRASRCCCAAATSRSCSAMWM